MLLKGSFWKQEREFWHFEVNFGRAVRVRCQLENRSPETRICRSIGCSLVKMHMKPHNEAAQWSVHRVECGTQPCSPLPAAPTAASLGCLGPARSLSICPLFPKREKMTEKPLHFPSNHTHNILWLRGNLERAFSYCTDNKIFLRIQTTLGKLRQWDPNMSVM